MQIEKDDVNKYIANVSTQNFESQDIVDAEISAIKAKKFADACEARLEIMRLKTPPHEKAELEKQEIKAVKARARASKMDAKWKLLTLGQPIKKRPPNPRPILPRVEFVEKEKQKPQPINSVEDKLKPTASADFMQTVVDKVGEMIDKDIKKLVENQTEQESSLNQIMESLQGLDAKINELKALPHNPVVKPNEFKQEHDLSMNENNDTSIIKADEVVCRLGTIEQNIGDRMDELMKKTTDKIEEMKHLLEHDILQKLKNAEKVNDNKADNQSHQLKKDEKDDCQRDESFIKKQKLCYDADKYQDMQRWSFFNLVAKEESESIKHSIADLLGSIKNFCNIKSSSLNASQIIFQLAREFRALADKESANELNQIKASLNKILGTNQDEEIKQTNKYINGGNDMKDELKDFQTEMNRLGHDICEIKSTASTLANNNSQFYFGQVLAKMDALSQSVNSLLCNNLNIGQMMGKLDSVVTISAQHSSQPIVIASGQQPHSQPVVLSVPQSIQPAQPLTTIVQQPPISVGVGSYPPQGINSQPAPIIYNYGQPQPMPYVQPAQPVPQPAPVQPMPVQPAPYAQPAQPAPVQSAPTAPTESPVQKMLADMASRLDAMKDKK